MAKKRNNRYIPYRYYNLGGNMDEDTGDIDGTEEETPEGGVGFGKSAAGALQALSNKVGEDEGEKEGKAEKDFSGEGALAGAAAGASIGSVVPGWGTAIGAVVGGVAGGFLMENGGPMYQNHLAEGGYMDNLGVETGDPMSPEEIAKERQRIANERYKFGSTPKSRDSSLTESITPDDPRWKEYWNPDNATGIEAEMMRIYPPKRIWISPEGGNMSYPEYSDKFKDTAIPKTGGGRDPMMDSRHIDRLKPLDQKIEVPTELKDSRYTDNTNPNFRRGINPYTGEYEVLTERQQRTLQNAYNRGEEAPELDYEVQDEVSGQYLRNEVPEERDRIYKDRLKKDPEFQEQEFKKIKPFAPKLKINKEGTEFNLGGNMGDNGGYGHNNMNPTQVTEFGTGGSHEKNPLGGIPQGIGTNGRPNLVEEGELKIEDPREPGSDYIISANKKMKITKSIAEKHNLPKKFVGNTVKQAADKILRKNSRREGDTIEENSKSLDLIPLLDAHDELTEEMNRKKEEDFRKELEKLEKKYPEYVQELLESSTSPEEEVRQEMVPDMPTQEMPPQDMGMHPQAPSLDMGQGSMPPMPQEDPMGMGGIPMMRYGGNIYNNGGNIPRVPQTFTNMEEPNRQSSPNDSFRDPYMSSEVYGNSPYGIAGTASNYGETAQNYRGYLQPQANRRELGGSMDQGMSPEMGIPSEQNTGQEQHGGSPIDEIAEMHGLPVEVIEEQFDLGMQIEMQNTDNPEEAQQIVLENLAQAPDYYAEGGQEGQGMGDPNMEGMIPEEGMGMPQMMKYGGNMANVYENGKILSSSDTNLENKGNFSYQQSLGNAAVQLAPMAYNIVQGLRKDKPMSAEKIKKPKFKKMKLGQAAIDARRNLAAHKRAIRNSGVGQAGYLANMANAQSSHQDSIARMHSGLREQNAQLANQYTQLGVNVDSTNSQIGLRNQMMARQDMVNRQNMLTGGVGQLGQYAQANERNNLGIAYANMGNPDYNFEYLRPFQKSKYGK